MLAVTLSDSSHTALSGIALNIVVDGQGESRHPRLFTNKLHHADCSLCAKFCAKGRYSNTKDILVCAGRNTQSSGEGGKGCGSGEQGHQLDMQVAEGQRAFLEGA